jgi:predicted DNA-binding protein YlxM (UPF0122 family)
LRILLSDYHALLNRQYQGDYDAVVLLADLYKAIEMAQLTGRQSEALRLVYEEDLTQEEAGRAMGIGRRAVGYHVEDAIEAISEVYYFWSHHGEGYGLMEDYKAILHEFITQAQAETKKGALGRELRFGLLERLTEWYYEKTGEMPDGIALERMSDLCLYEELSDTHPDKVTRTEYPFFSETQFEERRKSEASFKLSEEQGVDGRNHKPPVRRERTNRELKFIDKQARARNKERKHTYHEFTKVQPVVVRKTGDE